MRQAEQAELLFARRTQPDAHLAEVSIRPPSLTRRHVLGLPVESDVVAVLGEAHPLTAPLNNVQIPAHSKRQHLFNLYNSPNLIYIGRMKP